MGRVVDTQLRVYGTQRLRVIDSSIQPEIVVTNTQASALMIGEKGADIVLKYWKQNGQQGKSHYNTLSTAYSHNANQFIRPANNASLSELNDGNYQNDDYVEEIISPQPARSTSSLSSYYLYNTNSN